MFSQTLGGQRWGHRDCGEKHLDEEQPVEWGLLQPRSWEKVCIVNKVQHQQSGIDPTTVGTGVVGGNSSPVLMEGCLTVSGHGGPWTLCCLLVEPDKDLKSSGEAKP